MAIKRKAESAAILEGMKPKDTSLFYAALVTSNLGLWLFALATYWADATSAGLGPNIGAGLVALLGWALGAVATFLFVLSYAGNPKVDRSRRCALPATGGRCWHRVVVSTNGTANSCRTRRPRYSG